MSKIEEYQDLMSRRDKIKEEITRIETRLEEKKAAFKAGIAKLKDMGIDTRDIKGELTKRKELIEKNIIESGKILDELESIISEYDSGNV